METEITLIGTFVISLFILRIRHGEYKFAEAGCIAMSAMLVLTSIGHFLFTKGMAMMIPAFIPFKTGLVYLTGIMELMAATGLLLPRFKVMTGWWLIIFFVLLLPANIYAAANHIDLQKATFDGDGLNHLWYRIPLQLFFIAWVYFFTLRGMRKLQKKGFYWDRELSGLKNLYSNDDQKFTTR